MSSITFYQACRIAAIKEGTDIPKLTKEMNQGELKQRYNYVYQVLNGQRRNNDIVNWFKSRLQIKDTDYNPIP